MIELDPDLHDDAVATADTLGLLGLVVVHRPSEVDTDG